MTPGGRGHPDEPTADLPTALDAYVDGQLAGLAGQAFEARLGVDAGLAAQVELQRRLDRSLRSMFVAPPFPGVPSNGHPSSPNNGQPAVPLTTGRRVPWRWSAAAAVLVLAVGAAAWVAYDAFSDPRRGFAEVYREQFLTGALPEPAPPAATQATGAATAEAFAAECRRAFGHALALKAAPAGLELQGVQAVPVISAQTVMLRARIDGEGVLVFVDRAAHDDGGAAARSASGCDNGCCGVRVFRRQLHDLVLYEMSSRGEPALIESYEFETAPAPAACGTAAPPSPDF